MSDEHTPHQGDNYYGNITTPLATPSQPAQETSQAPHAITPVVVDSKQVIIKLPDIETSQPALERKFLIAPVMIDSENLDLDLFKESQEMPGSIVIDLEPEKSREMQDSVVVVFVVASILIILWAFSRFAKRVNERDVDRKKDVFKRLRQGRRAWNRWREVSPHRNLNLRGFNLHEWTLKNYNFRKAALNGANLQGAELQGADLQEAYLVDTSLLRANLQGANLQGANLREANLERANLQGTNLSGATLTQTTLVRANLRQANITGACLYGTARDDWIIDNIICDYVYWDFAGKERTPNDRDFRSGEFEELYKSLPTFIYYFEQGFTPIDPLIIDRVVQAINERQPEIELTLKNFEVSGTPHATFTVLHKEALETAKQEVARNYEERLAALEGKQEQMMELMSMMVSNPQKIEVILGNKQITAGDHFDSGGGHMNIAKDQGIASQSNEAGKSD